MSPIAHALRRRIATSPPIARIASEPGSGTAKLLIAMLSTSSVLVVAVFLGFFFLLCGGFSIYILAVLGGLVIVGLLHYLIWGHQFSAQVADEREQEETQSQLESEDWPPEELGGRPRF